MSFATSTQANEAYPPLSDVRKTLRVRWYRSPIDHERLRALSVRSNKQGWIQAGGHAAILVGLAALTVWFWTLQWWIGFILSLWCTGFVATFFKGTAVHELGHGTVFKSRFLNRFFLHAFCLISWWDPYDYAASHTYHHRFTTHRKADRENVLPLTPSLHPWLLFQLTTFNLFLKPARNFSKGGFLWTVYLTLRTAAGKAAGHTDIPSQEWLESLHQDHPESFQNSVRWSRVLLMFHTGVFCVAVITGWWVLPLVITIPSYIANIGSYLLGTTQHCGLMENHDDFRKNTRSISINPFLAFLYWHMNWHTEHHMYAGVPCYNLGALAKELAPSMPVPRTLLGAWQEMRDTWRRQQVESHYEFDTPLPAAASRTRSMSDDNDMVSSIGNLAPADSDLS